MYRHDGVFVIGLYTLYWSFIKLQIQKRPPKARTVNAKCQNNGV